MFSTSVSLKLIMLTLSSSIARDSGALSDRGVPPHRGEGHIYYQMVAITIEVQGNNISSSSRVVQRAQSLELRLDDVTGEANLLDDGHDILDQTIVDKVPVDAKGTGDRVPLHGLIRFVGGDSEQAC